MESSSYGEQMTWHPERPKFQPVRLVVSWLRERCSPVRRRRDRAGGFDRRLRRRARRALADRDPQRPSAADRRGAAAAVHGPARVRARARRSTRSCSSSRPRSAPEAISGRRLRLGAARGARRCGRERRPRVVFGTNDDDTYTLRVVQRIAKRQGGSDAHGHAGHRLPRDRRPRAARSAPRDARRQCAEHGALGGRRQATS